MKTIYIKLLSEDILSKMAEDVLKHQDYIDITFKEPFYNE